MCIRNVGMLDLKKKKGYTNVTNNKSIFLSINKTMQNYWIKTKLF